MKRMHIHVSVDDLAIATKFYGDLFGTPPSVAKADYAKWMLDEPRVNFAISARGAAPGLDHLGIQVDDTADLDALSTRLEAAGHATYDKGAATCCYAESEKAWTVDPSGIRWEAFRTHGDATTYSTPRKPDAIPAAVPAAAAACCGPKIATAKTACC
jgi:catechol-2,3-dioxygenase